MMTTTELTLQTAGIAVWEGQQYTCNSGHFRKCYAEVRILLRTSGSRIWPTTGVAITKKIPIYLV